MKLDNLTPWIFGLGAFLLTIIFIPVFLGTHEYAVTCSRYHDTTLGKWWSQNSWKSPNITLEEFRQFPFPNGLTQLDAVFVNATPSDIDVGDIMVFQTLSDPPTIAHRVIKIWTVNWTHNWTDFIAAVPYPRSENLSKKYFSTVGDNWFQQPFEREIKEKQVVGKMIPKNEINQLSKIWIWYKCWD